MFALRDVLPGFGHIYISGQYLFAGMKIRHNLPATQTCLLLESGRLCISMIWLLQFSVVQIPRLPVSIQGNNAYGLQLHLR